MRWTLAVAAGLATLAVADMATGGRIAHIVVLAGRAASIAALT